MNVAIFTDNDFGKVNGVTTTLAAALEHAPDDLNLRVYTCDDGGAETGDYLSLAASGVGIPDNAGTRRARGSLGGFAAPHSNGRKFPHRSCEVHADSQRLARARPVHGVVHATALQLLRADPRAVRCDARHAG